MLMLRGDVSLSRNHFFQKGGSPARSGGDDGGHGCATPLPLEHRRRRRGRAVEHVDEIVIQLRSPGSIKHGYHGMTQVLHRGARTTGPTPSTSAPGLPAAAHLGRERVEAQVDRRARRDQVVACVAVRVCCGDADRPYTTAAPPPVVTILKWMAHPRRCWMGLARSAAVGVA